MNVLVACECSGVVRDAFIARGHNAVSCDLLPSAVPGPHIQEDVLLHLNDGWDMMIAHPPCTDLAVSGARYFKFKQAAQLLALEFVQRLFDAKIHKKAIENPISIISTRIRRPDQIIQPHQFGHDASKATCLWLENLPKLTPTCHIAPRITSTGKRRWDNQTDSGQNRLGPSPERAQLRSTTYQGIADAMATQWT